MVRIGRRAGDTEYRYSHVNEGVNVRARTMVGKRTVITGTATTSSQSITILFVFNYRLMRVYPRNCSWEQTVPKIEIIPHILRTIFGVEERV